MSRLILSTFTSFSMNSAKNLFKIKLKINPLTCPLFPIRLNPIRIYLIPIYLIPLLLFFPYSLPAQTPEQLLNQGNKFYQEQNYYGAVESYEKILKQGFESAQVYFNLGNAYFKESKLGYAIFYYEKGLKLEPGDEDIAYNLKLVNARTVDKISEVPKIFLVAWWEGLITSLTISGWAFLVVMVFWILLASIAIYFFSKRSNFQRISFMSASITLSVLILVVVILVARINRDSATDYGILVEQIYTVKATPDEKSGDAFIIHEGIKFSIEDRVNDWAKIRLNDGKVGWIQKNSFGQI